ncbi:MAG: hypothetical protein LC790_08110 [Actinobacteria bacterium]|nr:hypothetical protein [Actinomycetota bacterium]
MPDHPPRHGSVTATGCQVCATPLAGRADQRFCSPTCRQTAHRRRVGAAVTRAPVLPLGQSRRANSIYECDDCGERLIGEQWCPDCQRPCRRLDFGGPCPSCGDAVTIAELIGSPMT